MGKVELQNVTKEFGDTIAVNDVSLTIEDGELMVLLGPSGCGKTTTLRTISGLEYPTEGRVLINDEDVTGVDPRNRDIAMVFQDLALYPHKTVRENMAFGLRMRDNDVDSIESHVVETAQILEIEEHLDRYPGNLSGGQQQRVALGRAIVRDPEVFLLDEPLSSLDAKLRDTMRSEILELHQELDVTMVYVTHDQEVAMTLGDRVAIMNEGQFEQVADTDTIYRRPASEFVGSFIGSPDMNLIDGWVEVGTDTAQLVTESFQLTLKNINTRDWNHLDGDTVRIGIRPQDIYDPEFLTRDYHDGEVISASVSLVEELGWAKDVHFEVDGTSFIAQVSPDSTFEIDDEVSVVIDTTKIHLFDRSNGERIPVTDELEPAIAD